MIQEVKYINNFERVKEKVEGMIKDLENRIRGIISQLNGNGINNRFILSEYKGDDEIGFFNK